jgi:phosphoesterase RecJ-like protein
VSDRSCNDFAAVADALAAAGRLVVTTHVRMDADAIGSAAAVCRWARSAGRSCSPVMLDDVPRRCAYLLEGLDPVGPDRMAELAEAADLVVVVDTCSFGQLAPAEQVLRRLREKVAVVDHHATADDVGRLIWRDTSASAAALMVAELLERLDGPPDGPTAEALVTGILSDTGWLRHSNTDGRTLRRVADLLERGVEPDVVYRRIYQSDRPQRVFLLSRALDSLQLHAADRLAVMTLPEEDFRATGAGRDETEDFINEAMRIATVEVAAILVEQADGQVRVSLRSRGGVDVSQLAQARGGGGHVRAAGFTAGGGLRQAAEDIVGACSAEIERNE